MKSVFFRRRMTVLLLCMLLVAGTAAAELVQEEKTFPVVVEWATHPNLWKDFAFDPEAELLEIWMPDIRDADASVLLYQGHAWMIDCGDERAAKRAALLLRQLGITRVEKLFNSHPHHDHLSGLALIDDVAHVEELLICFPEDATEHMKQAMTLAGERGITVEHYADGDDFAMGDGKVSLHVWQNTEETLRMNEQSAQMMLRFGERSMLFTGDMEKPGQRALLERVGAEALKADVLKYPHHGKLGLVDEYLEAVAPKLAVITNYRQYGESYYYLGLHGVNMVYTNRDKIFLRLATDGKHWVCEYVPIEVK